MARGNRAQQKELIEDPGRIEELHAKALEYAAARDARMQEGKEEVKLKGELLNLMKQHKKKVYMVRIRRAGLLWVENVECEIVPTGEKLQVRIKKEKDTED